jgi:phosphoribosylanthranilate isomerase
VGELASLTSFVKICGVTSSLDAQLVADAGADAVGLIFADSSRRLGPERGSEVAASVDGRLIRVGVFRDQDATVVTRTLDHVALDAVQVHGPLDPVLCRELRARGVPIIRAVSAGSIDPGAYDDDDADAVLVDGAVPGSGVAHPWPVLASRLWSRPMIVAGGLRPETVVDVLERTGAWGCDVATGVEERPGVKSPVLVAQFVSRARRHFATRGEPRG